MTSDISNYELKRKLNIAQNQDLLRQLGLNDNDTGIAADIPKVNTSTSYKKRPRPYTSTARKPKVATRLSRRQRGEIPEEIAELSDILDENDRVRRLEVAQKKKEEREIWESFPDALGVPITLTSIGTTIWELGKLNTGKGRSQAWSSRSCRYKHPYPIGYRATKTHFGNDYTMGILPPKVEGEGPIFTVQHKSKVWTGITPTAPWTEACLKSKSHTTRVSGPLFFGFSDPLTMKLIEEMEGYDDMALPEEEQEE